MSEIRRSVTAIVLAGGRARRFGGPKLDAEIGGATLLEHALRALPSVATEVVVAGPAPASPLPDIGLPIRTVPDAEAFGGPLAALAGALHAATTDLAIVVGGDMPALEPEVLRSMLDRLDTLPGVDAVLLEAPPKVQVLPLALRIAKVRPVAAAALAAGDRSLVRLVERLSSVTLTAPEWRALDPAGRTLFDVDEPADLDRLPPDSR